MTKLKWAELSWVHRMYGFQQKQAPHPWLRRYRDLDPAKKQNDLYLYFIGDAPVVAVGIVHQLGRAVKVFDRLRRPF